MLRESLWARVGLLVALVAVAGEAPSVMGGISSQAAILQPFDRDAARWVERTLDGMTLQEKVGQLVVAGVNSTYLSSDSDDFEALARLARDYHIGGFHLFGGRQPAPRVLLNASYGSVILGQPLEAASLLNRLQGLARTPLLVSADFETGVGFRIEGVTAFPRAMAFGAVRDEREAYEAGRITAVEARAIGVHVNSAPVVDVSNNPSNSVINTRSFGEDPEMVGALAAAYGRGLRGGGMLATLKHFPGHGDTEVDTHLGLARIAHSRERLSALEWRPFVTGIEAGMDAVMTSHISLPAIDPSDAPTTFSHPIVSGVLRDELGFDGLVYTDSMSMGAVSDLIPPGDAAVRAIQAGHDVVLHSPDPIAAVDALRAAVEQGALSRDRLDRSVRRMLRAKAAVGLHRERLVALEAVPALVGGRAHRAVAEEISQRAITLVRDARDAAGGGGSVPLRLSPDARLLYLSVLDYPAGWAIAAPSGTLIPELRLRWDRVTAVELSDQSSPSEIDLVGSTARQYDAVVAGVFVRTASSSGRTDLSADLVELLGRVERETAAAAVPFVVVFFGNPYVTTALPQLSAMLLTYDFHGVAERSAVRALAGEAPIDGRLPITLPGVAAAGSGLTRPAP